MDMDICRAGIHESKLVQQTRLGGGLETRKECPVCGKLVQPQGFGGHMWGVHGIRVGERALTQDLKQRVERLEQSLVVLQQIREVTGENGKPIKCHEVLWRKV